MSGKIVGRVAASRHEDYLVARGSREPRRDFPIPVGLRVIANGDPACIDKRRISPPCNLNRARDGLLMRFWQSLGARLQRGWPFDAKRSGDSDATSILDHYVTKFPSPQNAIDATRGWNHAFPPETGMSAGSTPLYHDVRIEWCLSEMATVAGRTILELGPLEGMHTYMLAKAGAAHIDAIEANALAYLRCLITKEILQIANASFLLGDFNLWLDQAPRRYDLIVASGVLYHSADPIRLIELISRNADNFYIWTHYFDDAAMGEDDKRRAAFSNRVERRSFRGLPIELHERGYFGAWRDPRFCGGFQDRHYWMTKGDILSIIDALGFAPTTAHDAPDHPNGPSLSIFARRI